MEKLILIFFSKFALKSKMHGRNLKFCRKKKTLKKCEKGSISKFYRILALALGVILESWLVSSLKLILKLLSLKV